MIEAAVVHTQGSRLKVHLLLAQVNAEAWLPWVINLGPCLGFLMNTWGRDGFKTTLSVKDDG